MKKLTWIYSITCFLGINLLILLFTSCNSTKKLAEGETLLTKNVVSTKSFFLDKSEIESYIKQKPNKKVLFWKFYLHVYNSVNQKKLNDKKTRRNAKIESINSARIEKGNRINLKREANGKKPKKIHLKKKNALTRREWLLRIGEPPVVFDSLLAQKSAKQINLYLHNKGYFNSTVNDSVHTKNKKTIVHYLINAGKPHVFRNVTYDIKDELLQYYVTSNASSKLIKPGNNYDVEVLQKERDRITSVLRNDGYYLFSKEFIYYEIDSSLGTNQVDVKIGIKNPVKKNTENHDSLVETSHLRFYVKNLYIHTDYDAKLKSSPHDTLSYNDYYLLSTGGLRYKPRLVTDAVFISKGELFQQSHTDQTYKRLAELKLFRSIQIQYVITSSSEVDCFIYLSNIPKQSFSAETEGINTSGTLGVAGSLIYQNKNTLKGGELFEVKLKGALEVQKTKIKEENQILTGIESPIPFNTLELGSEVNLYIPRFVTPFSFSTSKNNNAKTNLTANYNFQRRPDYGRSIANTAFGYSWNETAAKRHIINPIEFNLVNIFDVAPQLQQTIDNSKDLFLKNSYSPHFTLGSRYAFIFSNQETRKKKSFSYLRFGAEASGNMMRGIFNLIDKHIQELDYDPKPEGISYTIENIPFSQYLRSDIDYRFYKILGEKSKLVYRIAFGIGKPLHNLRALPLEKSFFAGGPNSLRAWQARTLGPGGYGDSTNSNFADKIGDTKLEMNLEYRFKIIKLLNAAYFVDAGNIWLRNYQKSFPQGDFNFTTSDSTEAFYQQIAIGAGMGIRLDFNFFILRLDWAFKLKDPARKPDDRWMFGKPMETFLNFGIGYPF